MEKGWSGLPYHTIAEHYKRLFGEKVYKIPVAVVDDCPNRMGLKGMKTCSFCDVWGSAARSEAFDLPLSDQIIKYKEHIQKKFKAQKFLVYFQAYTNTFTKVSALKNNFDLALSHSDVMGFVLGTRPDCLSPAVLNLWQEYNLKSHVAVELGVQSFFNDDLEFMRRGHSAEDSLKAIQLIADKTTVDLGLHLIFGSPDETAQRLIETARICNDLPITNIKLHNMHVLKNTELEKWFHDGLYTPPTYEKYRESVGLFLSYLHPRIAIQRLSAYSSRWDELISPEWTKDKMKTHQGLIDYFRQEKIYQGCCLVAQNEEESVLFEQMKKRIERSPSI